jgi:hypothetical protein
MVRLLRNNPNGRLDKLLRLEIDFKSEYIKIQDSRIFDVYFSNDNRVSMLREHEKNMVQKRLSLIKS